ncbi:variable large family protein (plasmid) [Borrelia coriaceae]|uniref:Variable large protein n=1 Tax=Borrelia coriaceae ATCC 43381 TaxID=1408429 RepID=W5SXF8_9SPIR|nr:variable large family protein [Borrelia coriaceae]AHH11358.1 Variable major protein [Borrelia coriaceae ATCC 43381]UPA17516.1 variable large family protein [Borrelia coriaceae]
MKNLKKPLSVIAMMSMLTSCELIADSISNQNGISLETLTTIATNQEITNKHDISLENLTNKIQQAIQNIDINNPSTNEIIEIFKKFSIVKFEPNNKRNEIGTHFKKTAEGLTVLKNALKEKTKNNDNIITNIEKIINAIEKLAETTDNNNTEIGAINNTGTKAALISNKNNVEDIINRIKEIIKIAKEAKINIEAKTNNNITGNNINSIAAINGGAGADLKGGGANEEDVSKLINVISQIDALDILNKIENATTDVDNKGYIKDTNNDAGQLIVGRTNNTNGVGAKSNADFAAAIALKAMSKDGKFAGHKNGNNTEYAKNIQKAAATAISKVVTAIDTIIIDILNAELNKIKK